MQHLLLIRKVLHSALGTAGREGLSKITKRITSRRALARDIQLSLSSCPRARQLLSHSKPVSAGTTAVPRDKIKETLHKLTGMVGWPTETCI